MYKLLIIPIILIVLGCSGSNNSTKIEPYLNYDKNYSQTLIFETQTYANEMGSFEEKSEVKFSLDAITEEGNYIITGEITRIQYSSDLFDEKESFDSDLIKNNSTLTSTEQEIYNDVKEALFNPFEFTMDRNGNIINQASYKNGGADPSLVTSYVCSPVIFPKDELYEGFEWEIESHSPVMESQKILTKYTVKSITEDKIILDLNMEIDAIIGAVKSTKAEGTYELDRQTKQFINGERQMKLQIGGGKVIYKIYEK